MVDRIPIQTGSVELGAFLKWAQVVETGGQAKSLIQSGRVRVNGKPERRRGRKLSPGDRVQIGPRVLEVVRG